MNMIEHRVSRLRSWWQGIVGEQKFEFSVPYSIEECSTKLKERSERGKGSGWLKDTPQKLLIRVDNSNNQSHRIYMHRDAGRNLIVEVFGTLESQSDTTSVQGYGKIGAFTVSFSILFLGIATLAIVFLTIVQVLVAGIVAILLLAILLFPVTIIATLLNTSAKARNEMINLLHETLQGSPMA